MNLKKNLHKLQALSLLIVLILGWSMYYIKEGSLGMIIGIIMSLILIVNIFIEYNG